MTNNIAKNFTRSLITPNSKLIIGLSGGPDSVFLFHQLVALKTELTLELIAVHLNHGWRAEAARDEQFCRELAAQHNLPFIAAHASEFPEVKNNGSQEALGRELRRSFFRKISQEHTHAPVALAHHKDDQLETFFIRLIRGAGLQGLRGMKPHDGIYLRPLLNITKTEILDYLHTNNIPYCIDHTNEHDTYLRNRIRKYALPALRSCDARIDQSLDRTMQHFAQLDEYLEQQVATTFAAISELRDGERWISLEKFFALYPFMQQQILLQWLCHEKVPFTPSQGLFEEIMRFLGQPGNGSHVLYQKWTIMKDKNFSSLATNS